LYHKRSLLHRSPKENEKFNCPIQDVPNLLGRFRRSPFR